MLIDDPDIAITKLGELRKLGVRLAMDDFGTGYSSLSYLSRFPVDVIKMDRSFLRAGASPEHLDLSSAVVALGSSLDLEVVAEGIELTSSPSACTTSAASSGRAFTSPARWRRATCSTTWRENGEHLIEAARSSRADTGSESGRAAGHARRATQPPTD